MVFVMVVTAVLWPATLVRRNKAGLVLLTAQSSSETRAATTFSLTNPSLLSDKLFHIVTANG